MMFIFLKKIPLNLFIGIYPEEQERMQTIYLDLKLGGNFLKAGEKDDLSFSVDYTKIEENLSHNFSGSRYNLLETLAKDILNLVFNYQVVNFVDLKIKKPNAVKLAQSVSISIQRGRNEFFGL